MYIHYMYIHYIYKYIAYIITLGTPLHAILRANLNLSNGLFYLKSLLCSCIQSGGFSFVLYSVIRVVFSRDIFNKYSIWLEGEERLLFVFFSKEDFVYVLKILFPRFTTGFYCQIECNNLATNIDYRCWSCNIRYVLSDYVHDIPSITKVG